VDTNRNKQPDGGGRQCRFTSLHSLNSEGENENPYPESALTQTLTGKLRNKHNQLDTHFTFTYTLLRFKVSTCFGHYLSIIRRHYTNATLVTIVCSCRCGLVSGFGKTDVAVFPQPEILNIQTFSRNTARFFPLEMCLSECLFSAHVSHLHVN
jgi:hypothetical protein